MAARTYPGHLNHITYSLPNSHIIQTYRPVAKSYPDPSGESPDGVFVAYSLAYNKPIRGVSRWGPSGVCPDGGLLESVQAQPSFLVYSLAYNKPIAYIGFSGVCPGGARPECVRTGPCWKVSRHSLVF